MPTYEYECTRCKHSFEKFQKITEPPMKKCPKCAHSLKRLIGAGAGIIFKGSGFYATDYKKKAAPAKEGSFCEKDSAKTDKCATCKNKPK